MKKITFLFIIGAFAMSGYGQTDKIVLVNTQKVGADRYRDIRGTPYFFESWQKGKILSGSGEVFEVEEVNYNGFTQNFEVRDGEEYIELDAKWYLQVEFNQDENPESKEYQEVEKIVFQKRGQANFTDRWMQVLYKGTEYSLWKEFLVAKEEKVFQNVGKEVIMERFSGKTTYYILAQGEMVRVKGKRKKTLAELGKASEAEKFVKKEGLNLKTDVGMIQLVRFYDAQ
ncbi:MAG: hypothetical protein AAGA10_21375 [Bacteroidota bacterium]